MTTETTGPGSAPGAKRIAVEFGASLVLSAIPLVLVQLGRLVLYRATGRGATSGLLAFVMIFLGALLGGSRLSRTLPGWTWSAFLVGVAYVVTAVIGVFTLGFLSECWLFGDCT